MNGISTITQKGQVAIPKDIRDYFRLKPSDKLHFSIKENRIIAQPILTLKAMKGFIPAKKPVSERKIKALIRESAVEKYAGNS